jgi:hypothetical protein
MESLIRGLGIALIIGGVCGCQCCRMTDHYADAVDCIATHETELDALYHPGLDLTRIGRADWCQCRINRALCPCACERRKPLPHIIDTSAAAYVGVRPHSPTAPQSSATKVPPGPDDGVEDAAEGAAPYLDSYIPLAPPDSIPQTPAVEPPPAGLNESR